MGPTLYRGLEALEVPVELYAPFGTPEEELQEGFLSYTGETAQSLRIPISWVALASIIGRITSERYHYPIGRVSRQKVAYFATQAGLSTDLTFERRSFGPYAEQSKRMFATLINNGLLDEQKRGSMFVTTPGPTLRDAEAKFASELSEWESTIERVTDLFLRLPSTREAELIATVHYVVEQLSERDRCRGEVTTAQEIVEQVKRWKDRLSDDEITGAIQTLAYLGWIDRRLLSEAAELDSVLRGEAQ